MEQSLNQPNPYANIVLLLVIMIPLIFIIRKVAAEKGKNTLKYTVLACIPLVNFYALYYIIATPSKIIEEKMDKIIEMLSK